MSSNLFLAALVLTLTLLAFGPAAVYFGNSTQFTITVSELLLTGVGVSVACSIVIVGATVLVARILWEGFTRRAAALLMSLGLAAFLQGTYLGWTFGVLDGREIDWSQPLGLKLLGMAIWIVPIVLPQEIARFRTDGFVRGVCSVLLIAQVSVVAVQLSTRDNRLLAWQAYETDASKLLQFSSDRNAMVIVLDEFQCDIFQNVIQRHPEFHEALAGFTFFPNAVAPSAQTFPSVPALLTGVHYDNSQPTRRYVAQAFLSATSLPAQLRLNGMRSELHPSIQYTVFASPEVADNSVARGYSFQSYLAVLKYGLLRSLPAWLKRRIVPLIEVHRPTAQTNPLIRDIWHGLKGIGSDDVELTKRAATGDMRAFRELLPSARVADQPPTFKFMHLNGLHVPIRLDEALNFVNVPYSRETVVRQAVGVVRLIESFVQRLKALRIYDRSVIIFVGDHGSGRSADMWLAPSSLSNVAFNRFKARSCPLLLAKPFSTRGMGTHSLQVSSAPVALTDIPATVLSELQIFPEATASTTSGVPGDVPFALAKSVFAVDPGEHRVRGSYTYTWERFDPLYLPPMSEFIVEGNVWDDRSWRRGRTFLADIPD